MEAVAALLNGPLPIVVTSIIALASLAGYWFFVIPTLEEVKVLRERNTELQATMVEEVKNQTLGLKATLESLQSDVADRENINELLVAIRGMCSSLDQYHGSTSASLREVLGAVRQATESVRNVVDGHSSDGARASENISREVDRLGRVLDQLSRQLTDVSDRQSQVAGILTGMSIAKSSNKSL